MTILSPPRTRLPGIYFQEETRLPEQALPRMDVAAFVGFAACGPIGVPVPIEDPAGFRNIFGEDLPLARDAGGKNHTHAYLAPAVYAFFNNGGRRCWVVRVAENAAYHHFRVPGLVRADNQLPVLARARCPGSWAGNYKLGSRLCGQPFGFDLQFDGIAQKFQLDMDRPPAGLAKGDLLRVDFPAQQLEGYLVVSDLTVNAGFGLRAEAVESYWFLAGQVFDVDKVYLHTASGAVNLGPALQFSATTNGGFELVLDAAIQPRPEPGDLIRLHLNPPAPPSVKLLLSLTETYLDTRPGSPPQQVLVLRAPRGYQPRTRNQALTILGAGPWQGFGNRLTFELLAWRGAGAPEPLRNLGFAVNAVHAFQGLAVDDELFWSEFQRFRLSGAISKFGLAEGSLEARFPAAAPVLPAPLYLPLGMDHAIRPDLARPVAEPVDEKTRLERDGLVDFKTSLFLDGDLRLPTYRTLANEADQKFYLRDQRLTGLHALWPLEEISLIAVPDAIHRAWELAEPETGGVERPAAPELDEVLWLTDERAVFLAWSNVGDYTYRLQKSLTPDFQQAEALFLGSATQAQAEQPCDCPAITYYRVRAERGTLVSPWSNTVSALIPPPSFITCELKWPQPPVMLEIQAPLPAESGYFVTWSGAGPFYLLQRAGDPAFLTAEILFVGPESSVWAAKGEPAYYRVRAQATDDPANPGAISPWSNTIFYLPPPEPSWRWKESAYDSGGLLALHRALIRVCAARADWFAVLSLPRHFREAESFAYLRELLPGSKTSIGSFGVFSLSYDEAPALDFAALYHPWPAMALQSGDSELTPPDGAVLGLMAERALLEGAWIAPANRVLRQIVALDQRFDRSTHFEFFRKRLNLLQREARGFTVMSADTLADLPHLGNINVRRLLILLRRILIREGQAMVFESNNQAFHRRVRRRFEQILGTLHRLGTFKGDMPEDAFRVDLDPSQNDHRASDQGRLVIDLRFAPALPLAFLTVRLVQTATSGLTIEEL